MDLSCCFGLGGLGREGSCRVHGLGFEYGAWRSGCCRWGLTARARTLLLRSRSGDGSVGSKLGAQGVNTDGVGGVTGLAPTHAGCASAGGGADVVVASVRVAGVGAAVGQSLQAV